MHKALHPRDDMDRLFVQRKEGGRGLTSNQDGIDTSIQQLVDYLKKCRGRLIITTTNNTGGVLVV